VDGKNQENMVEEGEIEEEVQVKEKKKNYQTS
jgi:hypothetical protein